MDDDRDFAAASSSSPSSSSSLRHKIRTSLCLSCCFRNRHHEALSQEYHDQKPRLIRASSSWLRSRAHEFPEFKDKCRNLFCRIGRGGRRGHSADFRYDPLSYALNFDEGSDEILADEFPSRNFSSRLPLSPPRTPSSSSSAPSTPAAAAAAAVSTHVTTGGGGGGGSREIAACS